MLVHAQKYTRIQFNDSHKLNTLVCPALRARKTLWIGWPAVLLCPGLTEGFLKDVDWKRPGQTEAAVTLILASQRVPLRSLTYQG